MSYKYNDIFDKSVDAGVKRLKESIEEIDVKIKNISKTKLNFADPNKLQKLEEQLKEVYQANEKIISTNKEMIVTEKKVTQQKTKLSKVNQDLNKEYQKGKIIASQKKKDLKDEIKLELQLERAQKKEIKSLRDLQKYTTALKNKRDNLDLTNKENIKTFRRLTKEINRNNNQLKQADYRAGNFQRNVGNYKSALRGFSAGWIAVGAAITGVAMTITKFIDSYNAQLIAEQKLTTVLKQRTDATDSQINSLIRLTAVQQENGVITDETQIAGLQQLGTFVDQEESLQQLLPAMNNLLAQQKGINATQGDAVNIANLMGRAFQGQIGALTRVGISFNDAQAEILKYGDESERAAVLAEIITGNVGDMNAALAQTDAGKLQQAKNVIGDLGEQIGGYLLPYVAKLMQVFSFALTKIIGFFENVAQKIKDLNLKQYFSGLTNEMKNFRKEAGLTEENISKLNEKSNKLTNAINKGNKKAWQALGDVLKKQIDKLQVIVRVYSRIAGLVKDLVVELKNQSIKTKETIKNSSQWVAITEFVNNGLSKLRGFLQGIVEFIDPFKQKVTGFLQPAIKEIKELLQILGVLERRGISINNTLTPEGEGFDVFNIIPDDFEQKMQQQQQQIQDFVDGMDISTGNGGVTGTTDPLADLKLNQQQDLLQKELELRQKYGNQTEIIETELYKFKIQQQKDFLNFVKTDYKDEYVKGQLDLMNLEKDFYDYKDKLRMDTYNNDLASFNQDLELQKLKNEQIILLMQQNGDELTDIEKTKLQQKKQLLTDYYNFLTDNANDANEQEIIRVENQLIEVETLLNQFQENVNPDDPQKLGLLGKILGNENFKKIYNQIQQFFNEVYNMIQQKISNRISLIDQEISKTEKLRDEYKNNADEYKKMLDDQISTNKRRAELGVSFDKKEEERLKSLIALEQEKANVETKLINEKEIERKKYEKKQQQLAIAAATIGVAQAVINGLLTQPFIPAGIAAGSLAAALGAVQLSSIKTQKFAEGTEYVELNGNPKGVDTIPAMVNEGERILPTQLNTMIPKQFTNDMIPLAVHHFLTKGIMNRKDDKENKKLLEYTKQIASNTDKNQIYKNGYLIQEKKGNIKFTYR